MSTITATTSTRSYDPNIIIRAANDKLATGDLAGGQTLFQSALLNWVDDAREGASGIMDRDSLQEAIATLWIAYAQFLMGAKQFKSATEAFEQAVECPIASTAGRVWLEYARFLEERAKLRTAQQVYIRALVKVPPSSTHGYPGAVRDEQDRNLLWNEFLEFTRNITENPDMTLSELQQAIQEEHLEEEQQQDDQQHEPASKRPRLIQSFKEEDESLAIRTHVVTPSDVDLEIEGLTEAVQNVPNDPTFMAAWLVRDGDAPPQPPLALFEAAPPKLSDPTGKDLLGEDLALAVVTRLLEPSGGVALQVCRGLWMWTLLQEQQSQRLGKRKDESIMEEYRQLQARLDERLSVAGAAEAAVRTMNQQELHAFHIKAQQERRELWNKLAWEARQLQWACQLVLNKLRIPSFVQDMTSTNNNVTTANTTFHGTTTDDYQVQQQARVCSYLHSAFFLRKRIGDKAHHTMLKSQQERLKQFIAQNAATRTLTPPPPPPPHLAAMQYPPPQMTSLPPPPPPLSLPPYGGGMLPPPPHPLQGMVQYPGYPPQQQPMAYPPQYHPPANYEYDYNNANPQQRW